MAAALQRRSQRPAEDPPEHLLTASLAAPELGPLACLTPDLTPP